MLWKILLLIPLFFAPTELKLNWAGDSHESLRVRVEGDTAASEECVANKLAARFRYEMRMCRKRRYWLDACADERREYRTIQFDPVRETYKVVADRLADSVEPETRNFETLQQALAFATDIKEVPLKFLDEEAPLRGDRTRYYVSARLIAECRGEYNQTVERISYIVSLGMVETSGFDSGWTAFNLEQ